MNTDIDIEKMMLFSNGDEAAFGYLFDKYKKKIINFCYRFCNNLEMAEELAQEVFIRLYRAREKYRPEAKFSTWLFKIATNICLNELRKKKYSVNIDSIDEWIDTGENKVKIELDANIDQQPENLFKNREQEKIIRDAINRLPEKQRAALILRVNYGFSYQEIGTQINKSENGVKNLIHRGRQALKKNLKKHLR